MSYLPTLCLDFDGVLHSYSSWSEFIDNDPPVEGAVHFCKKARQSFTLVVCSSRCSTPVGKARVERWLKQNGFPLMEVTCTKPIAFLTLDDRALTFTGTFPRISELKKFEPWWKNSEKFTQNIEQFKKGLGYADPASVSEGSEA